ncbi:DUF3108 domain-containing protein [Sulfurimonas sp.]|nr:DUF3108 domain-containing protein [Sulfurimonas sp.]
MKKILIILLTVKLSLFGYISVQKLKFESGITIYGQIGYVDVVLTQNFDNNTYEMKATTTSIGAVQYLTNNRKDIFTSQGQIKDGIYIPFRFTKEATKDDYKKITTYHFNYEEDTVYKTVSSEKYETQSVFDPMTFSYKDEKKLIQEKSERNIKLYKNDYLSLYLNMKSDNLEIGKVFYIDKKDKDTLIYKEHNLVEVQKNHGDDIYNIAIHHDENSIFFKKIESIGVSFYGDAYIEKISDTTEIIENK